MADISFKVPKRAVNPVTFSIDGDDHEYTFTPGKQASLMMPVISGTGEDQFKAVFDWLGNGLSEDDLQHLIGRLEDPKDDLDLPFLNDFVQQMIEYLGDRPTM